jgi:quercetin dioxygenase-like cupin family protein
VKSENSRSSATVVSLDEIYRTDPDGNGVHWSLEASDDLNVNLVHLDPGSAVEAHTTHEVDVVLIVLEGDGRLSIDATNHELAPHVLALAVRGDRRSISAGPLGVTYLTIHRRRDPLRITPTTAPRLM